MKLSELLKSIQSIIDSKGDVDIRSCILNFFDDNPSAISIKPDGALSEIRLHDNDKICKDFKITRIEHESDGGAIEAEFK